MGEVGRLRANYELKAVLASFGLKTTNYIFRDEISTYALTSHGATCTADQLSPSFPTEVTEPVIVCVFGKELVEEAQGQTKATEAWLVKILIAPLSAWNGQSRRHRPLLPR